MEELTPIQKIFSDDNNENVILYNLEDQPVEFEQIAIVPIDENDYCILKPVTPFENMADDEALVFVLNDNKEEPSLDVVTDESIIDKVFDVYYELIDEKLKKDEE